jgi:hypothetical protein
MEAASPPSHEPGRLDCCPVSAESVALVPQCAECGAIWLASDARRWMVWWTDDELSELPIYYPETDRDLAGD